MNRGDVRQVGLAALFVAAAAAAHFLHVTPVLAFAAKTLTLVFPTLLAIALLLSAGVGALVVYDGESTWKEGRS